jgi:hypothetical protein
MAKTRVGGPDAGSKGCGKGLETQKGPGYARRLRREEVLCVCLCEFQS